MATEFGISGGYRNRQHQAGLRRIDRRDPALFTLETSRPALGPYAVMASLNGIGLTGWQMLTARALELARVIAAERPGFADWMAECERKIMVELMEEAEARGEFSVSDKNFTAETIQSATLKFRVPQLWSELSLAALERELDGVLTLLLQGLSGQRVLSPA